MVQENLEIKKSAISGNGVFAKKAIRRGETICFMQGKSCTLHEMIGIFDDDRKVGSDPLGIDDEMYIDLDELYRSINHSCSPNAFISGKNELVALRDISEREEITYDYSTTMDDNKEVIEGSGAELWTVECNCKSKDCRRIIGQFKTLAKEVQEYYLKNRFAPDFILRKFS